LKLFVTPFKPCTHLKGKKPSEVTPAMLRKSIGGGSLELCVADAWEALVAAAKADGVLLTPTSSGDMFRSIAQQKKGFLQRYQQEFIVGASTRTYNGKKWYLKKGNAPLAAPNDDAKTCSKHMLGIAVDVAGANGERLEWMFNNIAKFGWSWEVVPEEPWHIRYVAGDDTPQAVLAWKELVK
jgi:LAS superfamily LD-carboxypeptidase LdcB